MLRALIFSGMWLAASASAQDVGVAWRFDAGTNDWRIADANERWVVLERDVAQPSGPQGELECTQEILVLRAETGAEVLRAPGWSQPIWTDVSAWFSLAVRPRLAGDRVIVLRDPTTLVALSLPDGRELWRAALPEGRWESAEMPLVVGGDRVLWLQDADIRALDAETGRQAFTLPAGAVRIAGSSIVHLAARSEMLRTFELETGRERARLSLGARHWPPVHFFASEAAVVVIDQDLRVLDPATLAVTARGPHVDPYRASAIACTSATAALACSRYRRSSRAGPSSRSSSRRKSARAFSRARRGASRCGAPTAEPDGGGTCPSVGGACATARARTWSPPGA